ncbi:hypothetical protein [Pantanalinema sp. GBBB05]
MNELSQLRSETGILKESHTLKRVAMKVDLLLSNLLSAPLCCLTFLL